MTGLTGLTGWRTGIYWIHQGQEIAPFTGLTGAKSAPHLSVYPVHPVNPVKMPALRVPFSVSVLIRFAFSLFRAFAFSSGLSESQEDLKKGE